MNNTLKFDFVTVWNPETKQTEVNIFTGNNSEPLMVIPLREIVLNGIVDDLKYQNANFQKLHPWMHPTDLAENRLVSKELRNLAYEYDSLVDHYTTESEFATEEEMLQEITRQSEEMGLYDDHG